MSMQLRIMIPTRPRHGARYRYSYSSCRAIAIPGTGRDVEGKREGDE